MTEVKLLTEAEAKGAWNATFHLHAKSFAEYCADLRERGLIAPEPVDPLLIEAREMLVADHTAGLVTLIAGGMHYKDGAANDAIRDGQFDHHTCITMRLPALRRGMELAPAKTELTREMVREAVLKHVERFGDLGGVRVDWDALTRALSERQA